MAKCLRCGRKGLFFKVNKDGYCGNCIKLFELEKLEEQVNAKIIEAKSKIVYINNEYNSIKDNRDKLYTEISTKAKDDALNEIADKIDKKVNEVTQLDKTIIDKKSNIEQLQNDINQLDKSLNLSSNRLRKLQTVSKSIQYSLKNYATNEYLIQSENDKNIQDAEEALSATVKLKLHLMDIRELKKLYSQNNKVIKDLLAKYQDRYTTKANMTIYRLMVMALEAELQNVLYNLSYAKLDKSISYIKTITAKYLKIATDGNQNIAPTMNKFIGEIEYLYIEAVKIEYEYYIQKERIKEEQKALRDQIRQEIAEKKLLEAERKKVEQEESKYENEIDIIRNQMSLTSDEIKIKQLEERLAKIQAQLDDVEKKKDGIVKLQNGKAGYIYVISNLGSFGDKMFKVGMTRRLNPQDRVDELGDASVPFKFDVHSFIFSESAPELELKLHKHLNNNRVNKINLRKEFFNTTIDELEELVYSLEPSAEFNKTMLAEQYYQSMAVEEVPENVEIIEDEDDESSDEEDNEIA